MLLNAALKDAFISKIYNSKSLKLHRLGGYILHLNKQKKLSRSKNTRFNDVKSLNINVIDSLPPLSWVCEISGKDHQIYIGNEVEHHENFIVEGVWDSDFSKINFNQTDFMYGSGIKIVKQKITFVPPKHCAEMLFVLHDKLEKKSIVSNSLCFALEHAGVNGSSFLEDIGQVLDETMASSFEKGIDLYDCLIAENDRYELHRVVFYNFSVNEHGYIKIFHSAPKKDFNNFSQYQSFLKSKTEAIFNNAKSPDRSISFKPITSISKGYDSPAVSVIAKSAGCTKAVTIDVDVYDLNDCGLDIGKKLGLETEVFPHILSDGDNIEVKDLEVDTAAELRDIALEFIATVGCGDDIVFYPFENEFKNSVFTSGVYGDFVWEKDAQIKSGLPKSNIFTKSITEFRLRTSYFHVPVPAIGARFAPPLIKISNSDEMREFSIGGNYDRPIPRRIAEEAGIDRSEFGIQKRGTAPHLLDHASLFQEALRETRKRYRINTD